MKVEYITPRISQWQEKITPISITQPEGEQFHFTDHWAESISFLKGLNKEPKSTQKDTKETQKYLKRTKKTQKDTKRTHLAHLENITPYKHTPKHS